MSDKVHQEDTQISENYKKLECEIKIVKTDYIKKEDKVTDQAVFSTLDKISNLDSIAKFSGFFIKIKLQTKKLNLPLKLKSHKALRTVDLRRAYFNLCQRIVGGHGKFDRWKNNSSLSCG